MVCKLYGFDFGVNTYLNRLYAYKIMIMNQLITHLDILSKLYQINITNMNIMLKYNFTYITAFQQARAKYKDNENKYGNKFNNYNLSRSEEIYQSWLKNSDNQLDKLLKSNEFISLLSNYLTLTDRCTPEFKEYWIPYTLF